MDNTAIEAIAKMAIANNNWENFVVTYGDQKLNPIEPFQNYPNQFRGQFSTALVSEFANYINNHGDNNSGLFIDHLNGKATAILDMGDGINPLWGKHKAQLNLTPTPAFKKLLASENEGFSQRAFTDFIEDYSDHFSFIDDTAAPIETKTVIAQLRRLKVETVKSAENTVGNYAATASAMESVEIKAAGAETPPAGFTFSCNPYDSFVPVAANCKLRATTDEKNITLKYRIIGLEALKTQIANQLLLELDELITSENIQRYIGTMSYQGG